MEQQFLDTKQAMNYLSISRSKLYTLGKKGLLRPRIGFKGNVYLLSDIEDFLNNLPVKEAYLTASEVKERINKK